MNTGEVKVADDVQDKQRKIVFICHSMGGIVVKKVLTGP